LKRRIAKIPDVAARGVFMEGDVAAVVLLVFDAPAFANGVGGLAGKDAASKYR
jgi:hypothetical protein